MSINQSAYDFKVVKTPIYYQDSGSGNFVEIPDRFALHREGSSTVYDVVSNIYEIVHHAEIVELVRDTIIPQLSLDIRDEQLYMWNDDAVMFKSFITEKSFEINGSNYYVTLSAVNSYTRSTKAGFQVTFMSDAYKTDEEIVLLPIEHGSIYTCEAMLHKRGAIDVLKFQDQINNIPYVVDKTIDVWNRWSTDIISMDRFKIISQLWKFRIAQNIIESVITPTLTRFQIYHLLCEYMLQHDKLIKSGMNAMSVVAKHGEILSNDWLFSSETPLSEIKDYVEKRAHWTWESKGVDMFVMPVSKVPDTIEIIEKTNFDELDVGKYKKTETDIVESDVEKTGSVIVEDEEVVTDPEKVSDDETTQKLIDDLLS